MDKVIYLICLGSGFFLLVMMAFLGHFMGGGHGHDIGSHGHAESGADGSDGGGVSAFSPTVIAAFVMSFGGIGYILTFFQATRNPAIGAPISAVGALGLAAVLVWSLRQVFSHTQSSSESQVATLAGTIANVITPIPENGVGEIAYVQGGTRYTAPARTEDGQPVPTGRTVRITRVVGAQFYVKPD